VRVESKATIKTEIVKPELKVFPATPVQNDVLNIVPRKRDSSRTVRNPTIKASSISASNTMKLIKAVHSTNSQATATTASQSLRKPASSTLKQKRISVTPLGNHTKEPK